MNGTKIKIREMTKDEALLTHILEELHEIKGHMCNSRPFESGVALGSLMSYLCVRLEDVMKKSNKEEKKREYDADEEENDEDEEEYEEDDETTCYKKLVLEKEKNLECIEEIHELQVELRELREFIEDNRKTMEKLYQFEFVFEYLLKLDHIYTSSLEFVIERVASVSKSKQHYYDLLPGKTLRMDNGTNS